MNDQNIKRTQHPIGNLNWLTIKLSEQGWIGFTVDEILKTTTEFTRLIEIEKKLKNETKIL